MDDAYPIADLDEILPGLLEGRSRVYYHFGRDKDFDLAMIGWVNRVRAMIRQGAQPPHEFLELGHLLHELRLFKSAGEMRLMQRAADVACEAQVAAMRATRPAPASSKSRPPAVRVPDERLRRRLRADRRRRRQRLRAALPRQQRTDADGDLLLVDAGAEYANYASDITRTWPSADATRRNSARCTNSCSTRRQAALAMARPGKALDRRPRRPRSKC
jgi:Xaa-Pro aminopeptidase